MGPQDQMAQVKAAARGRMRNISPVENNCHFIRDWHGSVDTVGQSSSILEAEDLNYDTVQSRHSQRNAERQIISPANSVTH